MTIHTDLARLQAEYDALTNLDPNLVTEEITKARESLHRRIGNTRALVADMAARESDAELRNRLRPPPGPPEPPPAVDAYGRPVPPPAPTFKTAREQFEHLRAVNPLQAAQFASHFETDIFGK
jgi:hypothetical protein